MRLGLILGYSGKQITLPMDLVKTAEAAQYDSVWTAEAYGSDAISPAAWILAQTEKIRVGTAIMQIPARTPAMCAMTAMTLAQLSNGRFILGLGASGPQVVEGWHGQPYGKPLSRTQEYIKIIREIMAREGNVNFEGQHYQMPFTGAGSVGLGKPLRSILQADTSIPIYTASITPGGLRTAAAQADGVFPVWMDPERFDVLEPHFNDGFAKAETSKSLENFDVAPFVTVVMGDDIEQCQWPVRAHLALYIGGMGAKGRNFYHTYASSLGYEEAADTIQDLYLAGKKEEAMAAIPEALIDAIALVGPRERIIERAERWKKAGEKNHVGSMLIGTNQPEAIELMAELML